MKEQVKLDLVVGAFITGVPMVIILLISTLLEGTDIGQRLETIGFILALCMIAFVVASWTVSFISWLERPWRSGSAQYQRLKNVTYTQLKSNIEDAERIKQVFYMNAEKCNVTHNTYEKDFGLMLEDLKR